MNRLNHGMTYNKNVHDFETDSSAISGTLSIMREYCSDECLGWSLPAQPAQPTYRTNANPFFSQSMDQARIKNFLVDSPKEEEMLDEMMRAYSQPMVRLGYQDIFDKQVQHKVSDNDRLRRKSKQTRNKMRTQSQKSERSKSLIQAYKPSKPYRIEELQQQASEENQDLRLLSLTQELISKCKDTSYMNKRQQVILEESQPQEPEPVIESKTKCNSRTLSKTSTLWSRFVNTTSFTSFEDVELERQFLQWQANSRYIVDICIMILVATVKMKVIGRCALEPPSRDGVFLSASNAWMIVFVNLVAQAWVICTTLRNRMYLSEHREVLVSGLRILDSLLLFVQALGLVSSCGMHSFSPFHVTLWLMKKVFLYNVRTGWSLLLNVLDVPNYLMVVRPSMFGRFGYVLSLILLIAWVAINNYGSYIVEMKARQLFLNVKSLQSPGGASMDDRDINNRKNKNNNNINPKIPYNVYPNTSPY
eukprot:TRINITY_DN2169_c0_g1_i4.p1 TRINITY_DN2169_c0_g1~~TRINITY_DN2169_c0_g1_i4.p1  ORF type:complete len:476 (-),score=33.69 TRINITY_DN2169_c0_g1_i4:307-1734(-)